ncbi:MAG: hypothetical protein RIG61_06200 [Deltaproteobacteria bacterium]
MRASSYKLKNFGLDSFLFYFFCFSALAFMTYQSNALGIEFEVNSASGPFISAEQEVLWDQTDNVSGFAIPSQNFTDPGGVNDAFDSLAADDFLIPGPLSWSVQTVTALGFYNCPCQADSVNIIFFADDGGLPGEDVPGCNYQGIQPADASNPNLTTDLPEPCLLEPGVYWVTVQVNMPADGTDQWFFSERTVQTLSPFAFENPGDGFSTGCVTFSPAQAECGATSPDLNFRIIGDEVQPQVITNIPSLREWGMIIMAAVLGLMATAAIAVRKRGIKV